MYVQRGTMFFDFEELKAWKEKLAQDEHCKMG
jgi:hypothetical protein